MAHVHASIGTTNYEVTLKAGRHQWRADEHAALGGMDAGPAPYEHLLAALGSCTAITLQMYAQRKQWPLIAVDVDLRHEKTGDQAAISRTLTLQGTLTDEQRARLLDIAQRTPVTLTLKGGIEIHTELR